jgi:hypothetical protein
MGRSAGWRSVTAALEGHPTNAACEGRTTGTTGIGYPGSQNELEDARIAFRGVIGSAESGEMAVSMPRSTRKSPFVPN